MGYLKRHWIKFILILILAASFFLMLFSGLSDSLTVDEKIHISAGYLHTWSGDYTFNAEHPPLLNDIEGLFAKIAVHRLPNVSLSQFQGSDQWEYGDLFFYGSHNDVEKIIFWARLPIILLTLGLIYLVFLWAKTLFGEKAGVLAALLTGFCPNILAHGHLATTDMGVAFFLVLALWLLRKFILKPSWINVILLGMGVSFAILAKFSGFVIIPILIGGFIYLAFDYNLKNKLSLKIIYQFLLVFFLAASLFWGVYAFSMRQELRNLPQVYTLSKVLGERTLSGQFSKIVIVPFDKFFQGYQILAEHNAIGHWSYLNGVVYYNGRWEYFPLVLWYKLTLPILILFGLAIDFFPKIKKSFFEEFFIIFPALLFLAISMTSKIDIGIRHILVILPFLFIFISRIALVKNAILKPIIAILVIAQVVIGIVVFPNYIAYFNEIAGGENSGIKHLADSNLDWNQNMKRFGSYAQKNEIEKVYQLCWDGASFEYYGVQQEILPNQPVNGVVVICAQQLVVPPEGFDFSWVTKYPPDDIVGHTLYVWRFDKKNVQ